MKLMRVALLVSLLSSCAGCVSTHRLGQFTAASSFNVRNLNYSTAKKTKTRTVGESCYSTAFFITFGATDDRLQRAMDNAIKRGQEAGLDGDLLVNVRIQTESTNYVFFSKHCMVVEGDLVKLKR